VCDNCRRGLAQQAEILSPGIAEPAEPGSGGSDGSEGARSFQVGDRVRLPRFGDGTVEELDGDALVVRFPGGRSRKFKSEFAQPVNRKRQKR